MRVIVLSITEQGLSKAEVAKKFSVSRRWINVLLQRYQEGGIEALEPRSKRPKTNSRSIPPDLPEQIKQMRYWLEDQGLDAGPLSIYWHLKRFGTTPPSTATIRRVLVKANMIVPEPRKRPRHSYIMFQADQPNETWQSDFTNWRLTNNTDVEILNILDDHSRMLLACKAYKPVTVNSVISVFEQAFRDFGTPQSTLTDNGAVFTAKYRGGKNKFEYLLDDLGIIQKNGSPNHPQTQDKIERFHQTLKT